MSSYPSSTLKSSEHGEANGLLAKPVLCARSRTQDVPRMVVRVNEDLVETSQPLAFGT